MDQSSRYADLSLDESFVVVRFNTIVVPGGKMSLAMEIITAPIIKNLGAMQ